MSAPRRFPPPWSIEERQESFVVTDATGQALAYVYSKTSPGQAIGGEAARPLFIIEVSRNERVARVFGRVF
jgi:hypothetical protein